VLEVLKKRWAMRLKQIRRICHACGTPSWGLHMPLGPHTVAGAGAAVAGECDDDRGDDNGGH